MRALEVLAQGERTHGATLPEAPVLWHPRTTLLGVHLDRAELVARLDRRVEQMWASGLLDEVRHLQGLGLADGPTASRAIGYAQAADQLDGRLTEAEAIAATQSLTRRYARRQVSWFRRYPEIAWYPRHGSRRAGRLDGMTLDIRAFELADTEPVISLWQETGLTRPWNNPHQDIARKLRVQPELFLVAVDGSEIVGSVMAGYDGHRGWLYYLASSPERRGEGIGRRLVERAEEFLIDLGCPKVQLMVRTENVEVHDFYSSLGFEPFEVWTTGKRLIAD